MRKSRFSEEQIIDMIKEHKSGMPVSEICQKHGISSASFYKYKAKFSAANISGAQKLQMLEAENATLKKQIAKKMLDNNIIKALLSKKW